MLLLKEINTIDDIKFEGKSDDRFCLPLFHGTRKHMLYLSDEERENYFAICHRVLKFFKSLSDINESISYELNDFKREMEKKGEYFHGGSYTIQQCDDNESYEYGDFYMVVNPHTAMLYAETPNGELSDFAYLAGIFLEQSPYEIPNSIRDDIGAVIDWHHRYKNDEKVIVVLTSADFDDLSTITGVPINNEKAIPVIKKITDNFFSDLLCYKKIPPMPSLSIYRLKNADKYTLYLVSEGMFESLESAVLKASLVFYITKALSTLSKVHNINISWNNSYELDHFGNYELTFKDENGNELPVKLDSGVFYYNALDSDQIIGADRVDNVDDRIILRVEDEIYKAFRNQNNQ